MQWVRVKGYEKKRQTKEDEEKDERIADS